MTPLCPNTSSLVEDKGATRKPLMSIFSCRIRIQEAGSRYRLMMKYDSTTVNEIYNLMSKEAPKHTGRIGALRTTSEMRACSEEPTVPATGKSYRGFPG